MGALSFAGFIITLFIILANEFDGIDAGRPKHGKKPLPPTVDWRGKRNSFQKYPKVPLLVVWCSVAPYNRRCVVALLLLLKF